MPHGLSYEVPVVMTGRRRRPGGGGETPRSMVRAEGMAGEAATAGRLGAADSRGGGPVREPDRRTVPYGFDDFQSFQGFAGPLRNRMREQYPDLDMGFQGSSVTGRSADTGDAFDLNRTSDFDIAIAGDSVYAAARDRGVPFRGDGITTGPLTPADLRALGLDGIVRDASQEAGRTVNLMIYRSMADAVDRKPTIRVWF